MRLIDADATLEQMKGMNMLFSPKIVIDNMPTISTEQIRADVITECLQIVQKIKDDYNDARFGEQIPINYGTLCGIIIELEQLKGAENDSSTVN